MAAQQSVARVGAAPVTARPSVFKSSQRILGRDWPIAWLFFLPAALLLFGLIEMIDSPMISTPSIPTAADSLSPFITSATIVSCAASTSR